MLMQAVTGYTRAQLLSHDDECLTIEQQQRWQALTARRLLGEPMAYILGEREFYGRMFAVNRHVLIPRADTETLIDVVLKRFIEYATDAVRVLDLGTGSGAIALTLAAERPVWQVCAVDVSVDALAVARENAQRHAPSVALLHSDWFSALPANARFDLMVSNPPYIVADDGHLQQGDLRFEPRGALTDDGDGLVHYRHIVVHAPAYLSNHGCLVFEHGFNQGGAVRQLLQAAGFTEVQTHTDLAGQERVTLGWRHSSTQSATG